MAAEWAAASARTLARRLRRRRTAENGLAWSAALAHRSKVFRAALLQHWQLERELGAHFPAFRDAARAARLLKLPVDHALIDETMELFNWAKHSPPPGLAPLRREPSGVSHGQLEAFRASLWAPPD
eukprot:9362270-Lingulodinium_polyedra.AAC.1